MVVLVLIPNIVFAAQKIEAAMCLLDSFGSAKTYLCNTASRHALKVTLEYDVADLLIGANMQVRH